MDPTNIQLWVLSYKHNFLVLTAYFLGGCTMANDRTVTFLHKEIHLLIKRYNSKDPIWNVVRTNMVTGLDSLLHKTGQQM